jgi:anaerobic magnesium-protoporphyrin IX monomethyl ester cyclase
VTLVYPYFRPTNDNSPFRFPPLGLGYIASYLRKNNISVDIVDCTFLNWAEAVERIRGTKPKIIGIQSMFTMKQKAIELAKLLRNECDLLIAGGPLPTTNPISFLVDFDLVVIGEGEQTMLELVRRFEKNLNYSDIKGIVYKEDGQIKSTPLREFMQNIDKIPFPARDLFDNRAYKENFFKKFGYTITPIMTSRGCPYNCDFCSRPVFGNTFRTRSPNNIMDEMEEVVESGYDRIWFADDCFTLDRKRLIDICDGIIKNHINVKWECLSRVDTIDRETTQRMKEAGCVRMFFGIESGNNSVLKLMNKQINIEKACEAVSLTKQAEIQSGAFFIIGYPGETDETILDTINFASSLPLDYLSFTLPYPIPGTHLYERVKNNLIVDDWEGSSHHQLIEHKLLYHSNFSEIKLKFAIVKGLAQFKIRKHLRRNGGRLLVKPFEVITDLIFRILK